MRIFRTVVLSLLPVFGLASTEALGASDFSLKVANPTEGATEFSTTDHKSGIFVLEFFQGHCGPCKQNVPNVKALYNDYKDEETSFKSSTLGLIKVPVSTSNGWRQFQARVSPFLWTCSAVFGANSGPAPPQQQSSLIAT